MKILIILFLLMSTSLASAQRVEKAKVRRPGWGVLVKAGLDMRYERDEEQQIKPRNLMNLALGLSNDHWNGEIEYASFKTQSGNTALSTERQFESLLTWGYWQPMDQMIFAPYVGLGVGGIRQSVTTQLYSQSEQDRGTWELTGAGALGARLFPKSVLWLSAEGRIYKNPYIDPDPQMGLLFRVGLHLQ